MDYKTADISDALHPNVQYVKGAYKAYGGNKSFYGPISTVKCFEDNSFVRAALDEDGQNRVLVVDAGGSMRCAMLGDQLAQKAVDNNWAGVVIHGLIRDSVAINNMALGVCALGSCALKSIKKDVGERDIVVHFGGVDFAPKRYLYADEDDMIVIEHAYQQ